MLKILLSKVLSVVFCFWIVSANAQQSQITYDRPTDPRLLETYKAWQEGQLLEQLRASVLKRFNVENSLSLSIRNCGQANAFYSPQYRAITLCWELLKPMMVASEKRFEKDREAWVMAATSAFVFVVYHEIGHAFVDILKTPTFGREEDNADQIATLLFLEDDKHRNHAKSNAAVLGVFDFWRSNDTPYLSKHQLTGSHSLGQQRAFNVVCWAIGSDPISRYKYLAQMTGFPLDRIGSCVKEFERATAALKELEMSSIARR